jgi:hypothetical protein
MQASVALVYAVESNPSENRSLHSPSIAQSHSPVSLFFDTLSGINNVRPRKVLPMKDSEFFKRAAKDAAFRSAKLEDLRYFKNVGAGLIWFCVILGAVFSIYCGITQGAWDKGFGLFFVAALCANTYSSCATRLAALQALDEQEA